MIEIDLFLGTENTLKLIVFPGNFADIGNCCLFINSV